MNAERQGLLIVGISGKVVGVDRDTGAIVWTNDLPGGGYGVIDLAIHRDRVIVSADGALVYALDYRTGTTAWKATTSSTGRATILVDGPQILVIKGGHLDCFDLAGASQWSQPLRGMGQGEACLGFPGNIRQADDRRQ